jgi:hypothetical protein
MKKIEKSTIKKIIIFLLFLLLVISLILLGYRYKEDKRFKNCLESLNVKNYSSFLNEVKDHESYKKKLEYKSLGLKMEKYLECNFFNSLDDYEYSIDFLENINQQREDDLVLFDSPGGIPPFGFFIAGHEYGDLCNLDNSPKDIFLNYSNNQTKLFVNTNTGKKESMSEEKITAICRALKVYRNNESVFIESEIINDWQDSGYGLEEKMRVKVGMAFQVGGGELAKLACDSIPVDGTIKDICYDYVDETLKFIQEDYCLDKRDSLIIKLCE